MRFLRIKGSFQRLLTDYLEKTRYNRMIMKKTGFIFRFLALFLVSAAFMSCGAKTQAQDDFGFYTDLDAAVKKARKEKKNILLFVTMKDFDDESGIFVNNVLHTDEYKKSFSDKFVSVHFDFGADTYSLSNTANEMTETERKAAEKLNEQINKNMYFVRPLNIQYTPVVYLMNQDGYAFADEIYSEDFSSAEKLHSLISNYTLSFEEFENLVSKTRKGTPVDKVRAVMEIYQLLDDNYLTTLAPLFKSVPEIDKKDESGQVSFLYFNYVLTESARSILSGEHQSAVQLFLQEAQGKILKGEERQKAYYMTAQMLISLGSTDFDFIVNCLNLAVLAAPQSDLAESCRSVIKQIKNTLESE